jgi:hypothetical protein
MFVGGAIGIFKTYCNTNVFCAWKWQEEYNGRALTLAISPHIGKGGRRFGFPESG